MNEADEAFEQFITAKNEDIFLKWKKQISFTVEGKYRTKGRLF